jgi:outer membrane protein TolC
MIRNSWKLVLIAAGFAGAAASAAAQGQAPVPVRVGFDQAIARALDRNPTVAQAATAIARADVLLQQARYALMPIAVMRVSNVTLDDARGFSEGITQPQNQFFFSPSVTVPLLAQRQRSAVGQARDQIEVATRSTAEVRQRVAVAAAQAYLGVIAARRQREVDERSLEAARAHLEHARRRLEGGVGSRLNEVRAAQAVAAAEARTEAARLGLRRAQEALGVLLAEDGPVDADAEPTFDIPASVDEAEWSAARPDLQFEAAVRRASERVIRDSWKDWMPAASASFDPQVVTPAGLFQPARTWRLTLSVTQPLFQGGQRKSLEARLAEVAVTQSKLAESLLRIQARSEIRMAQESVASLERAQASTRQAAEHANEVLRITTTAFEVGATTNIEVIDAQRSARDAETAATLAEDAVRRARLDLLVGLGRFPK